MSALYVVSGIQAAGKSTIARLLAQRFPRGVYVDGDVIRAMVVAGRVDMSPEPTDEAVAHLLLRYEGALSVAATYLRAGFDVVVADVIIGDVLPKFLALVPCATLHLVFLDPSLEAIQQREADRTKTAYGPVWSFAGLHRVLVEQTPRLGLWLDSSGQRPEETVDAILAAGDASLVHVPVPRVPVAGP
jgi:adenylylsulfate kinase-like enzyme